MDKDKRSGYRTLLMSVLLSAPGPLVLGLGLMVGHSSTQISDFTRRTAELMALIVSFVLYYAALGAATNTYFWRRYTFLFKRQGNSILGVQARLYGAKSFVDICVTSALAAVLAMPGTKASFYIDTIGSVIVSLYMIYCGIRTIKEFN